MTITFNKRKEQMDKRKIKIPFYEKYNPLELFIWRNKKHFGRLLKYTSHCGTYGTRYSKWKYDFATGEFVFNTIKSWYYPQDRTDARIIQDKDIVKFAYKKSSPENVYDGIEIKYNYDYAKKEYLAKKNYGLSGKIYELESNYYNLEVGVDKLGQYLLYQYRQQKLIISMTLPLKYIDVDVGDIVRMDKLISNLKAYGKDYTSIYASEGQYVYPIFKVIAVNKNLDSVNIEKDGNGVITSIPNYDL